MQKQRKASNTTTSEIVLESLREQIINGTLQPQEKLAEAEIAQKFGLSRGPVREALRQLAVTVLIKGVQSHCFLHKTHMKSFFCAAASKSWQSRKATAISVTIVS